MIYAASGIWFAARSPLYWDPTSYIAAAAGLEYALRRPYGLSFAARALAGPARTVEEVVRRRQRIEQVGNSLQLHGGGDLSYRSATRELGLAVSYGSGRTGAYRRLEATAYLRLLR
jgi:hypothetical protein